MVVIHQLCLVATKLSDIWRVSRRVPSFFWGGRMAPRPAIVQSGAGAEWLPGMNSLLGAELDFCVFFSVIKYPTYIIPIAETLF